jgi:tetratricopeptide (TPR) repeat protein
VRWPLRVPVLALLLGALVYLGNQTWRRTQECYWLARADEARPSSDEQIGFWRKAYAAENRNFETAYSIGEALRMQSWRGLANYRQPAEEACRWFERAIELNPFDPWPRVRLGMCLDWLERAANATTHFQRAFELDPNNGTVVAHVGWHYFQLENYAEARDWLERSYHLNWDTTRNPIPASYLAIIRDRFGDNPPRK